MGDLNQLEFVRRHTAELQGPVLEIGSKDYGTTQDLRALFPDADYTGVDLAAGDGVDLVLDLTVDGAKIDEALGGKRFGTIFSLSVMEHCEQPFVMAERVFDLLAPGGTLVLSVPFAWVYHAYPDDYWRFTPQGVAKLFPNLDFDHPGNCLTTGIDGDIQPLDDDLGKIKLRGSYYREKGRWWRGLFVDLLRVFPMYWWLTGQRKVLPMCHINMIGKRPEA
jgi:hypothetical protein